MTMQNNQHEYTEETTLLHICGEQTQMCYNLAESVGSQEHCEI